MKYKIGDIIYGKYMNITVEITGYKDDYYIIKFVKGTQGYSNCSTWGIDSADRQTELDQSYLNELEMKRLLGVK